MTVKCPKCKASVKVPSQPEIGAEMRSLREKKGLSLRAAAKRIGQHYTVLSRREAGKLRWTDEMMEEYRRL